MEDTTAPARPGKPTVSAITGSTARLAWTASTDNVGVSGYDVYRGTTKVGTAPGATFDLTGLTPATAYTVSVVARDAAGNSSPASESTAFTTTQTPPPPTGGCTATYTIGNAWQGAFQAEVTVKNQGTSAIGGWTVTWKFTGGQTITQLWSGTHTQTGADVSVKNVAWNGNLAPNGSTTFGFTASLNGTNGVPVPVNCTAS